MTDFQYAPSDITGVGNLALLDGVPFDWLNALEAGVGVDGFHPSEAAQAYSTHQRVASTLPRRTVFK